ncbi:L-dopachrome tautomerase-related protein [uncultured Enterovirga sp.]|uniref:L-dopachrome tautomerase-related protein n=1 Tax=uncultured Enterovirga sp. TaxID=2026352 RepID=UPI0035CAD26A
MQRSWMRLAGMALALTLVGGSALAQAQPAARLERVAVFPHQVTGVAVSNDGRIFLNFPRWTEDSPVSVAELKGGRLVPYPDAAWNSWRNAKQDEITPNDHWVCVQSVVADGRGNLWVLDPAAPALEQIVKGGPKLVQIDLATNKVVRTIAFDERVAPQGTYLNDIRFSPDGKWAYLTDSGRGALLVVDLESSAIRRVLDGVSSTQAEKGVQVRIDGRVLRRPDGKAPTFASDGIALSRDGEMLFWQAISSRTLYSIPTAALRDDKLQNPDLEAQVKKAGTTVPADGFWMSSKGTFFVTSPEDNSVKIRQAESRLVTVAQDPKLRWPDSLAEGPDGAIYVTASHIPDTRMFKLGAPVAISTALFRFMPPQ